MVIVYGQVQGNWARQGFFSPEEASRMFGFATADLQKLLNGEVYHVDAVSSTGRDVRAVDSR